MFRSLFFLADRSVMKVTLDMWFSPLERALKIGFGTVDFLLSEHFREGIGT